MVERKRAGGRKVKKVKSELSRDEVHEKPDNEMIERINIKEIPVFRQNVGARNPFVIAKRKLQMMDRDVSEYTPEDLPEMMEIAFPDYVYEELFDPKFGSPVYHGIFFATLRLAKVCPKQYAESLYILQKDPARKTGEIPIYCKGIKKSQGRKTEIPAGRPLKYRDTAGNQINFGLGFNDPEQGCIADCWLISALSSVAWAETNAFPRKLSKTTPIYLYAPKTDTTFYRSQITTSMDFFTDDAGSIPYYAKTNKNNLNPAFYECWPSFYEKCFAGYVQKNRVPDLTPLPYHFDRNDNPEYSCLNFGSSFLATEDLTGMNVIHSTNTIKNTEDYLGGSNPDSDDQIIEDIRINACNGQALDDGVFIPTTKPSTTYTYLSENDVPNAANHAKYGGSIVTYCAYPGLPANHAFSILGVYQLNPQTQYIVLRNPWGTDSVSQYDAYTQAHLTTDLPAPLPPNPGSEGIIGLESECFMRYFESFGWTG